MGVLTDYFRATDAATVVRAMQRTDGGPLVGTAQPSFDGVEAKFLDPVVVLGKLIATVKRVPWDVDLVEEAPVWPTTPTPDWADPPEGDAWVTGPWVTELGTATRDALAEVPDCEVREAVDVWVQVEELRGVPAEQMQPVVDDLIRLARRAREAGEQVYCWTCL